jgi:uncharacterized membrane protein
MQIVKKSFTIASWLLIIALSAYFFMVDVFPYVTGYRSKTFGQTLLSNQLFIFMHLVGGTMALLTGPTQFWPSLRQRYLKTHRLLGKIYMFGILLIGISAIRLAPVSRCVPCRISMLLVAIIAVLATWFAWKAIKTGNIKVHRQMMVRSYICVVAFVTVRLNYIIPPDFLFGPIEDSTYRRVVNEYFFSFVPLIVAEMFMVWWPSISYSFKKR